MNTQIAIPHEPITIFIPRGITTGFEKSIFPWHQLGASTQTKGDAGVSVVLACMKAADTECKKVNGQGDILLTPAPDTAEVKYIRETINEHRYGLSINWRANGIRPNEPQWKYIYFVVEQGDHADNSWLVLEFDRDSMLDILDHGIISMYGQPGADEGATNVMEIRAHENSRRREITEYLKPRTNNIIEVPQSLLRITYVEQ